LDGILVFVAESAGATRASLRSGVRIDAKLQPERMNVITDRFHSMRKSLRVDNDVGLLVAADLPAVVNVHVYVSSIFHSWLDHRVGHSFDHVLADVALEFVPGIPAHRRSEREVC